MTDKISEKDIKAWNKFIDDNDKLFDKEVNDKTLENRGEATLDLHGFNLRDANFAVKNLINKSYNVGIEKLTIITGKGLRSKNNQNPFSSNKLGILKFSVPDYVQNDEDLMEKIKKINIKEIENMNSGSFSIYLKKKK